MRRKRPLTAEVIQQCALGAPPAGWGAAPQSAYDVMSRLVRVLEWDNGGPFDFTVRQIQRARDPIDRMLAAGFFLEPDWPTNLDSSYWQMAAGEEEARVQFFARVADDFQIVDAVIQDIFGG